MGDGIVFSDEVMDVLKRDPTIPKGNYYSPGGQGAKAHRAKNKIERQRRRKGRK
jgi:hypothetical protein